MKMSKYSLYGFCLKKNTRVVEEMHRCFIKKLQRKYKKLRYNYKKKMYYAVLKFDLHFKSK